MSETFRIVIIADTHLKLDDVRGEAFRGYTQRMAEAYTSAKHYRTNQVATPEDGFIEALSRAVDESASLVALLGDIVSFPSEAAIEWAAAWLNEIGIPWTYTAGNHDWHYEGMPGSDVELRARWIKQRLMPLYGSADPMMSVRLLNGVRFVTIDDSTNEISPDQLEFFRAQVATGAPVVLFIHIPLFAPGRSVKFGCGHPEWGTSTDTLFTVEQRRPWRRRHTPTTMAFRRDVFSAPNVLAVFAGHNHEASLDVVNGVPQCVVAPNLTGAHLVVEFASS
ncbi:putative phosphodiesterase [Arthrobacter pigmenti]|uniref:Putative phosphodiesterase n=1 Tax=Arthrobacter pigmenti TaxID=271432 RepID=A0A846RMH6_9MICC|nr:putative phosphodiesterase [Arthrobacter pigmenti]